MVFALIATDPPVSVFDPAVGFWSGCHQTDFRPVQHFRFFKVTVISHWNVKRVLTDN